MGRVESVMIPNVARVHPDSTVLEALAVMRRSRISCLVICDEARVVGIVTERDLAGFALALMEEGGTLKREVGQLMTSPVITVRQSHGLDAARQLADRHRIRHLPVVDDAGSLVGILTQTDLLRAYSCEMEAIVQERTRELAEANRRLEAMALQDGLLGIRNRRALDLDLEAIHATYIRYQRPYSVVLCDVDEFKRYNDSYGHLAGDDVLRSVADRIVETMRTPDTTYRYGGEEILVLLPETRRDGAGIAAERIRASVESLGLEHRRSRHGIVTVSCGWVTVDGAEQAADLSAWRIAVIHADQALYRAKRAGRNRVEGSPLES